GANVIPHVAKATGIYLNSMLATMEVRRAGYDEAILLTSDGYIADGPGENIFVVRDGVIYTPDLSASILPGITRDTVIQIAQDLKPVPLSGPYVDEREEELVLEVLRSGRLSLGPMIDRFEEAFAARVGAPYAAAVSSGTAGLHLLCVSAGIRPGDEVITSPYSFAASANCFVYEGGVPVFADVDARTLNLDPAAVEAAVTPRTRAIVAVD